MADRTQRSPGVHQDTPRSPVPLRRISPYGVLWGLGWLLIGAMAVFQVSDVLRRRDIVLETTQQRFASLARALAEQTARSLQVVDVVLRDTSTDERFTAPGAAEHPTRARELRHRLQNRKLATPQIRELVVVDSQGRLVAAASEPPAAPVSLADRLYFSAHRDDPSTELRVSEAFQGKDDGIWTVALSRRIDGTNGRFRGVAVAFLDLDSFRNGYAAVDLGAGSNVSLFHRNGVLLVRYPDAVAEVGRSFADQPLFQALAGGARGMSAILHDPVHGSDTIQAAQVVSGFPFVAGAGVDRAAILRPWNIQASHSAVRTTSLCLSVMLLMWLVLRQLRRREKAEASLRVQTALLDELFESAPEAIVMLDLQERVTRVNREFSRIFGYAASEAHGRPLDELIVPDDLKQEARRMATAVNQGHHTGMETERIRKDGGRLHVSVMGAPIVTATGQIASYAIYRDMTEHKLAEAERAKLESRLRQAGKLEAIGTMAGGIAHDFNNILGAILGYGDMAITAAHEGSALKRYIVNVMTAAHRAKALIDQILTYSRSTRGKRGVVAVGTVTEETLELMRASLPADIELKAQLGAAKANVIGDPTQIHQLVMNLCTNAIHAMRSGGVLTVSLDAVDTNADRNLSHGLLPAGRYVRLSVQDTGCGMEPGVIERIFEPFFTTKESGSGTGLGLALVQGILTELGGAIEVTSQPGAGSKFDLYLPRSDALAMEKAEYEVPLERGRGEHVLLVEDEKALMLLAEEMLAALGYEPVGFTRGGEALAEFRTDPQRFDAVVIDHLMPGMTGTELARRLRETRPDIPIVMVSGYVGPLLNQEALSAGIDRILTKPLDFRQLADVMAQVLRATTH